MRIRLQDVAERSGVSASTVSRVMNARPEVNDRTRLHVLRTLAEMGYDPPGLGPDVAVGLVGLLVPELDNPIFPAFAQAIEARLASSGYVAVLCCATREAVHESDYVEMLVNRGVAGIIIVSGMHADTEADLGLYIDLMARNVPLVFVNGYSKDLPAPFVSCDDRHAGALAVRHLAGLGHSRIGFISGSSRYVPVVRKLEGYHKAVRAHGLVESALVSESIFSVEGGHVASRGLIAKGATAIVAASDVMALGAIRAAHDVDLRVPGDVSVVGFDDTSFMAFTDPPLTTIRQPVRAMSELATQLLLDQIAGAPRENHEYLFRGELVVRGSTAPPSPSPRK
ncbi:MAG: LacI family DNA-binding transcriptional regulator [Ilumatobacteraceae bacterium]